MIWLWFAFIQLINIPLMVVGWFICLSPKLAKLTWLWWNDEDGAGPVPHWFSEYMWLAWRNPVANLKHVPGISKVGRPLFYRHWGDPGWYIKMGWMSNGYPAFSAGSGRGY